MAVLAVSFHTGSPSRPTKYMMCQPFTLLPVFWTMPTQLLSGTALAAGIGFVNLFGAVGGFIAPILRVKAETLFASDAAGLLTLAAVAVIGSLIIFTLRVNRTVAQTDVAHH